MPLELISELVGQTFLSAKTQWRATVAALLLPIAAWILLAGHPRACRAAEATSSSPPAAAADHGGAAESAMPSIPSKSLLGIIRAGGILMIPIFFCSFLMLVFAFERLIALRRGRVIPLPFVKRFLHQLRDGQLDRDTALKLCAESKSPVANVFAGAVRKWGKPAVEVEQAILDEGERTANALRRYVRMFNGISTISPLLGLLGTVFGMIRAFNEIASSDAMGRPELLASGISEALLTTAAGLIVAIPALACYLFFISRVDQLVIQIDALGQEIVQIISAEALQEASPVKSRRREAA
jgi:biopolymer transport protein ExbB